ncbi:hypothetical protein CEG14_14520 [Bordetella genomosp. 1]|uniref:Nucleoside transporter/FeoB GTPase Gate domain-containing protein n=2 Tax=Bordetella genomosp. 1 TaxID=1395607 RepID=A0A261SH48_9BORD|nr:hypothetical protein CEG14_14520 [Bordetella genomosp. 1]OZI59034.1 hypothetical protein CAL27_19880 [Bordetella genomosp. 1]
MRRSGRMFYALAKIMVPIMALVQVAQWLGWIEALGQAFGPVMGLLNLPAGAGIVWIASVLVGLYGAIAALIGLSATLDMTTGQFSALASMILFAHSLPVEQAIVRRAGASFWATTGLRLGAAVIYGGAVSWLSHWSGWLTEPMSFQWLQGSQDVIDPADYTLWQWLHATAFSLLLTYAVILALLVLLDVMKRIGLTALITRALTPVLRWVGLDASVAPVTMVGTLLGLSYGGALIIEEAERLQLSARTRFLALSWLSLSHSLIEDTALVMALGADGWVVLGGRVVLTLLVVGALARLWRADTGMPQPRPA